MILRLLNFVVIGALVLAAAYVYRIKFDSTVQAEHLAKLRSEQRHERDRIAALRAEWGQLDNPARVQALANRFLQLKQIAPTQFDTLDRLPERPSDDSRAANDDPIAGLISTQQPLDSVTGSIPAPIPDSTPADPPNVAPNAPPAVSPDAAPDTSPAADEPVAPDVTESPDQ
jgi:cell division protein FtsL